MKTLAELADEMADQEMQIKEAMTKKMFAEYDYPDADALAGLTQVQFYRNGEAIAFAAMNPDRDDMIHVALNGAYSFSADQLGLAFEGYAATGSQEEEMVNPDTGDAWERNDMNHMARNERGLERGVVTEALIVHVIDRAKNFAVRIKPFSITNKEIVWKEDEFISFEMDFDGDIKTGEGGKGSGVVNDAMRYAMDQPTLYEVVSGQKTNDPDETEADLVARRARYKEVSSVLDEERQWFHMDMAAMKQMASDEKRPDMMMLGLAAPPGSKRSGLIEEGMNKDLPEEVVYVGTVGPENPDGS